MFMEDLRKKELITGLQEILRVLLMNQGIVYGVKLETVGNYLQRILTGSYRTEIGDTL